MRYSLNKKGLIYRVCQNNASEGDVWFFNPKNVTIGSGVHQTKILPFFDPLVRKGLDNFLFCYSNLQKSSPLLY